MESQFSKSVTVFTRCWAMSDTLSPIFFPECERYPAKSGAVAVISRSGNIPYCRRRIFRIADFFCES